jgi:hypothetical protein
MSAEIGGTTRESFDPSMEATQKLMKFLFIEFSQQITAEIGGTTRESPDPSMEAYQKLMKFFLIAFLMNFLKK